MKSTILKEFAGPPHTGVYSPSVQASLDQLQPTFSKWFEHEANKSVGAKKVHLILFNLMLNELRK